MPSVAHEPLTNGVDSNHKEKTFDLKSKSVHLTHNSSGFTAVNSSNSTSPTRLEHHSNGSHERQNSVRSGSEEEQKLSMSRPGDNWAHTNGYHPDRVPSAGNGRNGSPTVHKRKRSDSNASTSSGERSIDHIRHRDDSYGSSTSPRSAQGPHNGHITGAREQVRTNGYDSSQWAQRERSGTLRSESNMAEDSQRARSVVSPGKAPSYSNGDDSGSATQATQAEGSSTTEITRAGVQVDPKKRKRQFANRTKTGCQTCRRRKKKCDEAKPECSNCIRGGFVCEGYNQKSQWKQPSNPRPPMPLVSKELAYDNQAPMYPRPPTHASRPEYEPHPTSQDGGPRRPIVLDDGERPPVARHWGGWTDAGPAERRSYTHPPPTEYPPHHPQEIRGPPPMKAYQEPVPMSQPPPVHSYGQQHQNAGLPRTAMSVHHPSQAPPQPPPPPESDKDKMLRGEYFLPFAPQLLDERDQCKSALWRFNNAQDPGRGVSREERSRLFRSVLEAPYIRRGPGYPPAPIGTVGRDVHVDAPFTCDYGYNINIGDNVVISSNCTIQDPCRITIGARTIIGPNVNILGMTVPYTPKNRNGSKGTACGMEIRIEEDVFIGGGVTIVPRKGGITIGKGSTIGAGSVVTKDVPRHTISAGNPSRVLRGIWQEPN